MTRPSGSAGTGRREVAEPKSLVLSELQGAANVALHGEGEASVPELEARLLTELARKRLNEELAVLGAP